MLLALAEALDKKLGGWRTLGDRRSDGEVMCAGCWDRSDHDTEADHEIPAGDPIFWTQPHPEYGDCDAYCFKCVVEDAEAWEVISMEEASALAMTIVCGAV